MDSRIFASNISKLRTEKMWSQEDLSQFLNVSRQAVSKWETAQSMPDIDILMLISKLFSITINDLIEKALQGGVSDIEEIVSVDKSVAKKVLNSFDRIDVIKAAKGVSPDVLVYICDIYDNQQLLNEIKDYGPVRLNEVELVHKLIVEKINQELI